LREQLCMTL